MDRKSSLSLVTMSFVALALAAAGCSADAGADADGDEGTLDTAADLSSGCTQCWVSTTGNDANAGSQTAPWRHLAYALTHLDPGDTLFVRGGTYVENITSASVHAGTATAPIRVVAAPGERPVLQGLLWLHSPTYWTFDGLNVTWNPSNTSTEHMVKLTNGTHWTFQNAEVWGAHSFAGILVASSISGQPANWTIRGNCIHDTYASNNTNQDHLIYDNSGPDGVGGVIERNVMFNATNGEGIKFGGPSLTTPGPGNVTVRYNTIYNTAQNVLLAGSSHDQTITLNILDKVGSNYGNVRGYQLSGTGNVASNNLGYQATTFIKNDSGYTGVANGGGNVFPRDPKFDAVNTCAGFHPQDTTAQAYGRYAP